MRLSVTVDNFVNDRLWGVYAPLVKHLVVPAILTQVVFLWGEIYQWNIPLDPWVRFHDHVPYIWVANMYFLMTHVFERLWTFNGRGDDGPETLALFEVTPMMGVFAGLMGVFSWMAGAAPRVGATVPIWVEHVMSSISVGFVWLTLNYVFTALRLLKRGPSVMELIERTQGGPCLQKNL